MINSANKMLSMNILALHTSHLIANRARDIRYQELKVSRHSTINKLQENNLFFPKATKAVLGK